jgi:hypothetical protein
MLSLKYPTAAGGARKHFRIVLIKTSHYDDDGYVIRWYRSPMPANSLASIYSPSFFGQLAAKSASRPKAASALSDQASRRWRDVGGDCQELRPSRSQ